MDQFFLILFWEKICVYLIQIDDDDDDDSKCVVQDSMTFDDFLFLDRTRYFIHI